MFGESKTSENAGAQVPSESWQWTVQASAESLVRGVGHGSSPRVWQAEPVQAPLEQVRAPPSHSPPSG